MDATMPDAALRITSYFRDVGEVPNSLLKPLNSAEKNKAPPSKLAALLGTPTGKAVSLTRAIRAAQKARTWPETLPTSARNVNKLLVDVGLLAEDRLPTEMGRHLGISVVDDTEKG